MKGRLYGVRLDTPSERGRVTPWLVKEVRAKLDLADYTGVKIIVSGGMEPRSAWAEFVLVARWTSFGVGSYIAHAAPIDFTGDLKEIDGTPIAKRGRIPGRTESPRLKAMDLAVWREI